MANPYKTMKVYLCKFGHVFPNWYSDECYECAVVGRKSKLLTATIKSIKYVSRWKKKPLNNRNGVSSE